MKDRILEQINDSMDHISNSENKKVHSKESRLYMRFFLLKERFPINCELPEMLRLRSCGQILHQRRKCNVEDAV